MRFVIITAILGLLVQPAFAQTVNCLAVLKLAELHDIEAELRSQERLGIVGFGNRDDLTEDQAERYDQLGKQKYDHWRKVEMFANIYSAFCK